jgi:hypothetical protein
LPTAPSDLRLIAAGGDNGVANAQGSLGDVDAPSLDQRRVMSHTFFQS